MKSQIATTRLPGWTNGASAPAGRPAGAVERTARRAGLQLYQALKSGSTPASRERGGITRSRPRCPARRRPDRRRGRGPCKQRGRAHRDHGFQLHPAAEEHRRIEIHREPHRPFALLAIELGVYAAATRRHAPVDAAWIIARRIGSYLLDFQAAPMMGAAMGAQQQRLRRPVRPQAQAARGARSTSTPRDRAASRRRYPAQELLDAGLRGDAARLCAVIEQQAMAQGIAARCFERPPDVTKSRPSSQASARAPRSMAIAARGLTPQRSHCRSSLL